MATYSFTETANKNIRIVATGQGSEISADRTIPKARIMEIRTGKHQQGNALVVDLYDTQIDGDYTMYPALDTITIGETTYAAGTKTVSQLKTIFDSSPVFLKANTGNGEAPANQPVSFNQILGAPSDNEALNQALLDAKGDFPYIEVHEAYNATTIDRTINCTNGSFSVNLPEVSGLTHYVFNLINSGTGTISITSDSTFNGAGSIILLSGHGIQLQEGNTQYIILSQY